MPFGVDSNSSGRNIEPLPSPIAANAEEELAGAVDRLHAEIHGIDDEQVLAIEPQLGGIVELAPTPSPVFPIVCRTFPFMSVTKILLRRVSVM